MPLPPKEEARFVFTVFASVAKQSPGREAKKYVILNAVKNPTEELTGIYFSLWSWDISLVLNMT